VQPLLTTVWWFLKKLNTEVPYDPAIPFLDIYPNEMKTGLSKRYLHSFTEALFTIVKIRKQPKCLSVGKGIKKIWHICTMDYYSALRKRKLILSFATTWKDPEGILLSEISQTKANTAWHHLNVES